MSVSPPESATIEVYVRELVPNKNHQLDAILNQLDQLVEIGAITDVSIHVVGKQVCPETAALTEVGRRICQQVKEFHQWAAQVENQIHTFFPTTDVECTFTEAAYRTISFPTIVMAEYVDEDLQFVTPCVDGDTTITPRDRLAELTACARHRPSTPNP